MRLLASLFLLLVFGFSVSLAQNVNDDIAQISLEQFEPGKCYVIDLMTDNEPDFALNDSSWIYLVSNSEIIDSLSNYFAKHSRYNQFFVGSKSRCIKESDRIVNQEICMVEIPDTYKDDARQPFITPKDSLNRYGKYLLATNNIESMEKLKGINIGILPAGKYKFFEVLCSGCGNGKERIAVIQKALMAKGYKIGGEGANNVLNEATRNALIQFQKDNNLPVGNLNMETLKALGVYP